MKNHEIFRTTRPFGGGAPKLRDSVLRLQRPSAPVRMPILECWRFISESTESTTSMGRSWYPLVNIQKAIENGHLSLFFPIKRWWFSIFFFQNVYQRVDPLGNSKDRHPCHSTFLCLRQHYCWVRAHSTIKHFSVLHDRSCEKMSFFHLFFLFNSDRCSTLANFLHQRSLQAEQPPSPSTGSSHAERWSAIGWFSTWPNYTSNYGHFTRVGKCPFLGICFTSPSTICWKSYPQ